MTKRFDDIKDVIMERVDTLHKAVGQVREAQDYLSTSLHNKLNEIDGETNRFKEAMKSELAGLGQQC